MNSPRFLLQLVGGIVAVVFLAGCAEATAMPSLPPPTLPPPPSPKTPQLPPNTPLPQRPSPQEGLFKLVQAVQVTPDDMVADGSFIRLGYVPALDRIVAVFHTWDLVNPEEGGCQEEGVHLYKVYTLDMRPVGPSTVLNCVGIGDSTALFVGNVLYDVSTWVDAGGWHVIKYDAATWTTLAEIDYPITDPQEESLDEMIMLVNGMLDISSIVARPTQNPSIETATHHNFFTLDLQFLERRILADTENIEGSSMIFVDDKYYFVTANNMHGDVIVMTYDKDWVYLGMKVLRENAIWSEGVAFDGQRFYVAYMDTSLNAGTEWVPLYTNIHLAAFDREWNFVEDLAVTNYTVTDDVEAWRPYVMLHGNRLYVSYDVTPHDPITRKDLMHEAQAYIVVYELTGLP